MTNQNPISKLSTKSEDLTPLVNRKEQKFQKLIESQIPVEVHIYCFNPEVPNRDCYFFMHRDCLETCYYATRIMKGIIHSAKTGLERFIDKYGENWRLIAFGTG